jgi:hypothetical protein
MDVLVRIHVVDGDLLVPMVGRSYDHGIHAGPGQHFSIIASDEDVFAEDFASAGETALIDVAGGDELGAAGQGRADIVGTLASPADYCDLDLIVGGTGLGSVP